MSDKAGSRFQKNAVGDGKAHDSGQGGLIYARGRREVGERNLAIDWNLVCKRKLGDELQMDKSVVLSRESDFARCNGNLPGMYLMIHK
jgi:hypothetical protein